MPFRSKAQQRWMFAAESRGELPKGTAMEWAHETQKQPGGFQKLPEKVKNPKKGFKAKPMKKSAVEQHIGVTAKELLTPDTKLTGLEALFPALALGAGGALYGAVQSPGGSPLRGAMIGGAGGVGAGLGFTGGHHFIKSKYGEPMASNAVAAGTLLGGAALGGHMGLSTGRALAEMTGVGDPKDKVDNDLEELDVMNGRAQLPGYFGDYVQRKKAFAKVADMFSTTGGGMAMPQMAPQPALGLHTDNEPSLPSYGHAAPMGEATPGFKPFQAQPAMMMQSGGFDLNAPGFAGQDVSDDQTDDGAGIKLAGFLLQSGRPKHKVSQPSKVTVSKGKSTIQNGSVHPRKAKEPDGKVRRFEADLLKAEAMSCEMKGNCKKAAAAPAATDPKERADELLPMNTWRGAAADYLAPSAWGGRRAGKATQLAQSMGQDVPFTVNHPMTSDWLGALGGGALGGAAGYKFNSGFGPDAAMVGTGIGALGGALAGALTSAHIRRGHMHDIHSSAEKALREGRNLEAVNPGFTNMGLALSPFGSSHHAGQADAYVALKKDEAYPSMTGQNMGYLAQAATGALPAGVDMGVLGGIHAARNLHAKGRVDRAAKTASHGLAAMFNFPKHAAAPAATEPEERADELLPMHTTTGRVADYMFPGAWGGRRAGKATQLAQSMGQDVPFTVNHPLTAGLLGGLGGATLGGLGGYALGHLAGEGGPEIGSIAGALGGSMAGALATAHTRRGHMHNIHDDAEATLREGGKLEAVNPEFTNLGLAFSPLGSSHHAGQADAYVALKKDRAYPSVTGQNVGYATQAAARMLPEPFGQGLNAGLHVGRSLHAKTRVEQASKTASHGLAAMFNFPKHANGLGYQHPGLQMPLEAGFWSDDAAQDGPPSALEPQNESILPAPSPELHGTPTPLPAAHQAPSWLSQHGLATGAGAAAGLGAYGLMNHLFGGETEDEEGRHKRPMSASHAALATGAGALGGAALSGGLGNALSAVPNLSFATH